MILTLYSRRKTLQDVYGFICNCPRCTTLPDLYRSFVCAKCNGVVCPIGETEQWNCFDCSHQMSEEEKQKYLKAEKDATSRVTLRNVHQFIDAKILHKV